MTKTAFWRSFCCLDFDRDTDTDLFTDRDLFNNKNGDTDRDSATVVAQYYSKFGQKFLERRYQTLSQPDRLCRQKKLPTLINMCG